MIIAVAGHVDHGKTQLTKALTGINTDSLPEEKSKLMTIDLGFAYLNENITIIDVPGHEKFIKNMVTGVSYIDFALMVVAADDGVKPQTVESIKHAKAANVPIVVAINKCDLPEADPQKVKNQLLEHELIAEDLLSLIHI